MDIKQQWLTVTLEEYKALRTESLTAMKNQQTMLSLGATVISISISFSTVIDENNEAKYLLFGVFIPLCALLFFTLYAQEFSRMVRVGRYIEDVEARMTTMFQHQPVPIGWETWLNTKKIRPRKTKMKNPSLISFFPRIISNFPELKKILENKKKPPRLPFYAVVPVTFGSITVFSFIVSFQYFKDGPLFKAWMNIALSVLILFFVIVLIGVISLKLMSLRESYDIYFPMSSTRNDMGK